MSGLERWFRVEACEETGHEFCWIYRLRSNGPFTLHPEEIDGGEWLAPAEVAARLATNPQNYCSAFTLIWAQARRKLELG